MKNKNLVEYINLNEINAYKLIHESVEKINNSYFFKTYNLALDEIKTFVKMENFKIFKGFNQEEDKLFEELLKYSNNKDYDKYFIEKVSNDSKINVLNYMYWQYKIIDTFVKIDLSNLKRILGIGNGVRYIVPLKLRTKCNKCGSEATVFINDYKLKENIVFQCSSCNHEETRYKNRMFPIKCKCESCEKLNGDFFLSIKNNFNDLVDGIKQQVENFYNETEDELNLINYKDMETDYKIYRSEMDKDIREVMSYNPKNIEELIKIVDKLHERNCVYNKKYKNQIIEKLFRLKILYNIRVKDNLDTVKDNVIDRFIHVNRKYKGENSIDIIQDFLTQCISLEFFCSAVKYYNSDRIAFNIGLNELEFFVNGDMNCSSMYDPIFKEITIVNKYYFQNSNVNNSIYDKTYLMNIFNSQKERSIYIELRNRYSKFIVYPNCKADNIIDITKIKKMISEDQYNYLKKCYFNFVILDIEGNPLKVIQLQKGNHHNEDEWKEKDFMKRRFCEVAGIEFEEMY